MTASRDPQSLDTTIPGDHRGAAEDEPHTLAGAFASALRGADVAAARAAAQIRGALFDLPRTPTIPRYRLERILGRGGMGEVWSAHDELLDREVAVKLVRATLAFDDLHVERLGREARSLARLAHPNVVAVFDVGRYPERDGRSGLFVVMELVEGQTLSGWLGTTRTWREIVGAFVQAGRGLAAAHGAGLVHRDFKPANVFVGRDGRVRVGDFGLARLVHLLGETEVDTERVGDGSMLTTLGGDLTDAGVVMGTPMYMSPEQHQGKTIDARSDQFSFCVALFDALWGEFPFRGNVFELGEAKAGGVIATPRRRRDLPAALDPIVRRGLAASPAARWPDMGALVDALAAVGARRRRPWVAVGAVALVGGAVALTARTERCAGPQIEVVARSIDRLDGARPRLRAALPAEAAGQAAERLQAWSGAFFGAQQAICDVDPAHETARWDCLTSAVQAFDAVTEELAGGGDLNPEIASAVLGRLPDVAACSDLDRPSTVPPELRARLEATNAKLERAIVRSAHRPGLGLHEFAALCEELADLPTTEVHVRAVHELAGAYDDLNDWEQANASYEACYFAGIEISDFDSAMRCAFQLSWKSRSESESRTAAQWLAHANAAFQRVKPTPEVEATRAQAEANVAFHRGDYEAARASFRKALDLCEQQGCGRQHASNALGYASVVNSAGDAEAALEAWRELERIATAESGPDSPLAEVARVRMSAMHVWFGRHEQARRELEAAIAAMEGRSDPDPQLLAVAWNAHAEACVRLGLPDAVTSSLRALEWARIAYARADHLLVPYLVSAGQGYATAGNPRAALGLYAEAMAFTEDRPRERALLDTARGAALIEGGELASALVAIDRAIAAMDGDDTVAPTNLAAAFHNRGLALSRMDRCAEAVASLERAIELYTSAPNGGPADSGTTEALLAYAECQARLGDGAKARHAYGRILAQPDAVADHRAKAEQKLAALGPG